MDQAALTFAQTTAKMLSGKWRLLILGKIQEKVYRPGELQRSLAGISKKVLTKEIQTLVENAMIERHEIQGNVRRVEYALTSKGQSLLDLACSVAEWGKNYPELFKLDQVDQST